METKSLSVPRKCFSHSYMMLHPLQRKDFKERLKDITGKRAKNTLCGIINGTVKISAEEQEDIMDLFQNVYKVKLEFGRKYDKGEYQNGLTII